MAGDDPRCDVAGAGVFGLTGSPRLSGMIHPGAVIATGKPVVAVGPQRDTIAAGMARPARVGDVFGLQAFGGAALRPLLLPHGGAVLVGIGVAARPIQGALTRPRSCGGLRRRVLLLVGASDLVDEQLIGLPIGE